MGASEGKRGGGGIIIGGGGGGGSASSPGGPQKPTQPEPGKPGAKPEAGKAPPSGAGGAENKLFAADESWKAEAQKEKEKLQERAAREEEERDIPPPSFLAFVSDLGLQAMLALGLAEIRGTGGPRIDLPAARYTIDLLGILDEKTRGNLTPEEDRHFHDLLSNLRVTYARIVQALGGTQEPGSKVVAPPEKKIIT